MKRERTAFDTVPQGVDFALPVPERAGPSPWRSAVDVKDDEPLSAAVVDWSALHHTWCLFEAPDTIPDPFIALLDLSTVIGALIFHDVVLVIDHDRIASRINGLFGIEGVVRGLEAPSRWGDESVDERIEKHFLDAQLELEQATRDHEPWIGWLCDRWERLLPSAQFPRHDAPAYERESQGQLRELDEPRQFGPYFGGPRRWESLFALEGRWYRARLDQEYGDLILDNDRRALFYDRLLEDMRAHHDDPGGISFRYLANCFRAPMQLTRTQLAQQSLASNAVSADDWLEGEWVRVNRSWELRTPMPFWLGAVLAASSSVRDMTSAVVRFRSGAARFRRNRQRVERELFEGNIDALERLSRVLQGDVRDLTDRAGRIAGTALELADTGVKAMVPVPFGPKTAAGLVPGATRSWFRERWLRLFRPQLWCVYDLGRNGRRIGNVVGVSFERFRLQTGVATEPLQFLDRLGDVRNPS